MSPTSIAEDTGFPTAPSPAGAETTVFRVIFAISYCHLLNDMMQSLLPAIYPG